MKALAIPLCFAGAALALAACSEQTQDNADEFAAQAARDTEANLDVIGEEIQDGAKVVAGKVSEGAADLQQEIEESDDSEPGPAPIKGDDL
jgi:hypothetical protein